MEALLEKIRVADQVTWRRWLHQHAELSFEEFETTAYIENLLRDVPNLTIERPAPTGLVATLHGAHRCAPCNVATKPVGAGRSIVRFGTSRNKFSI